MQPLKRHTHGRLAPGPLICVVLDGVGIGDGGPGDAVAAAQTPALDMLRTLPSYCSLVAHGTAVGMPSDDDMGNSEVGHNTMGAGRAVDQGAKLVGRALASGALFEGATWRDVVATLKQSGQPLHLLGLLSDGNVHSHIDHVLALCDGALRAGLPAVRVHVLLDGRDVPARSAMGYVQILEEKLATLRAKGCDARIASGGGRMRVTMDRYGADWSVVERGWQAHVHGHARAFCSAQDAIQTMYGESDRGDQDLDAFVIVDERGEPVGTIENGAAVVLWNFRGDRAIEISQAFENESFPHFNRGARPHVFYAGMTQYDGDVHIPARYLVEPPVIEHTMGELLAHAGCTQLALAETHKFGHVTYFWNGNRSGKFSDERETYLEIPSDLRPLQERPWMKAAEVTDALIDTLQRQAFDMVRVNFANGDMVGHTGVYSAARLAVEVVDLCVARLMAYTRVHHGMLMVTADHGNADQMLDRLPDGTMRVRTSHSLNPVPFSVFVPSLATHGPACANLGNRSLANVAATCLDLLGFASPAFYAPTLVAR